MTLMFVVDMTTQICHWTRVPKGSETEQRERKHVYLYTTDIFPIKGKKQRAVCVGKRIRRTMENELRQ